MPSPLPFRIAGRPPRVLLALVAAVVLGLAILSQPARRLSDFDQLFYVTIAFDLDRYGVFSNSVFDNVDSTAQAPPAGMFFGPVYPSLVLVAMRVDRRFAQAVEGSVEAINEHRDEATCEPDAVPMRIIHALLLTLGVFAIALAG